MREIKFRAYDKINKKFINLYKMIISKDGQLIAVEDIENEQYGLHQIHIMQYTGLKDKNGTEIYEGDILSTYNDDKTGNVCCHLIKLVNKLKGIICLFKGHRMRLSTATATFAIYCAVFNIKDEYCIRCGKKNV